MGDLGSGSPQGRAKFNVSVFIYIKVFKEVDEVPELLEPEWILYVLLVEVRSPGTSMNLRLDHGILRSVFNPSAAATTTSIAASKEIAQVHKQGECGEIVAKTGAWIRISILGL